MDSGSEEELTCPVCCEIFKAPVFLSCSHNVCKECLQQFWEVKKTQECPVCRRRSSKEHPPRNLALKNLCESFTQKRNQKTSSGSEMFCSLHSEKFKLYCLEDKEPVCLVCRDSQKHVGHIFRPINEIVSSYKEELSTALKSLQEKLKHEEKMKEEYNNTADHIKTQAEHTENQIKQEFKKLHQFLTDEEEATITALKKEKDQKSQMMKDKLEEINRQISALSETIKDTEEIMKANDISFLNNFKATMERAQISPPSSEMVSGALINVADHLGNLPFRVWKKMQQHVQYTPVILDPNTAHPKLILSDDLTNLRCCITKQPFPNNPERFEDFVSVLGSEGFLSGKHCWDVEVGDCLFWETGITTAGERKFYQNDVWGVGYNGTVYFSKCPGKFFTPITVEEKLQIIRVQLDYDTGRVSFIDLVTNRCLHTLTATFKEKVFPFLYNNDLTIPLKVLPVKVFVTIKRNVIGNSLHIAVI